MVNWRPASLLLTLAVAVAVLLTAAAAWAEEQEMTISDLGAKVKLDPATISVSGISSGGFMAHAFHVAHSKHLIGAGIIAGGPYHCAQGSVKKGMLECTAFLAVEGCANFGAAGLSYAKTLCQDLAYSGPGPGDNGQPSAASVEMASVAVNDTLEAAAAGKIDPPEDMTDAKVLLIQGAKDGLLPRGVMDAVYEYYRRIHLKLKGAAPPPELLTYDAVLPTPHAVPTDNFIGMTVGASDQKLERYEDVNSCGRFGSPYLNACTLKDCSAACSATDTICSTGCTEQIDAAGSILRHIYGTLQPRSDSPDLKVKPLGRFEVRTTVINDCKVAGDGGVDPRCDWLQKRLFGFRQSDVFDGDDNKMINAYMADKGYVFVPPQCMDGRTCKLHIAFHGCMQGYDFNALDVKRALYSGEAVGLRGWTYYVENTGYNEWADANDIVVLYPQARQSNLGATIDINPTNPWSLLQHLNPQGCWDIWGYTNPDYATKDGLQISAVWREVKALVPALKE